MWKAIFWGLDPRALRDRSVVAADVLSWAPGSVGSWREGILVPWVAVDIDGSGQSAERGWWQVSLGDVLSYYHPSELMGFISFSVPWEAVLFWFCAQRSFNQHCIKCEGVSERGSWRGQGS